MTSYLSVVMALNLSQRCQQRKSDVKGMKVKNFTKFIKELI